MNEEFVEIDQILHTSWAIITQRMVQQEVQTPQGPMQVQQPIQVPIVFRNLKEVQRYVKEQYAAADVEHIVLQKIMYDAENKEQMEFYYKEDENDA